MMFLFTVKQDIFTLQFTGMLLRCLCDKTTQKHPLGPPGDRAHWRLPPTPPQRPTLKAEATTAEEGPPRRGHGCQTEKATHSPAFFVLFFMLCLPHL